MRGATSRQPRNARRSTRFQSTLLMRGATTVMRSSRPTSLISIHAPHARSDYTRRLHDHYADISIHAPHARSDTVHYRRVERLENFNPRSSCEERRTKERGVFAADWISIHAPHARSDSVRYACRGLADRISIHAPHARSDYAFLGINFSIPYFNPRSSCEERPDIILAAQHLGVISIHAPHARSDQRHII